MKSTDWIKANENKPRINKSDKFCFENKTSIRVLTYSNDLGLGMGVYLHNSGYWVVDGYYSSKGTQVEYWQEIKLPKKH